MTSFGFVFSFSDAAFMSRSVCILRESRAVIFFISSDNRRLTGLKRRFSKITFFSSLLVLRRCEMFAFLSSMTSLSSR